MIEKWQPTQISNMLAHHRIITSSYWYKILNSKISLKNSLSRGMKCQPKAINSREAVVVCARHVVKGPSKRMRASIYIYVAVQSRFWCNRDYTGAIAISPVCWCNRDLYL